MRWKQWGRRVLATLLCVCMAASLISAVAPEAQAAATPGTQDHIADGNTMYSYKDILNLDVNSRYVGRVWADKSVVTGDVTLREDEIDYLDKNKGSVTAPIITNDSDFLHIFSVLGSSQEPSTLIPMPLDVVFILDSSWSMAGADQGGIPNNTRLYNAGLALDEAVRMLMTQGSPYNRVGLVHFNSKSYDAMELGRYTGGNGKSNGTYFSAQNNLSITINAKAEANTDTKDPLISAITPGRPTDNGWGEGMTNTQSGIYRGMNILATEEDTTIWLTPEGKAVEPNTEGAVEVNRIPIVILLSDGQPTYSLADESWWSPNMNDQNLQGTFLDLSYAGNGLLAIVTATYMKRAINRNYFGGKDTGTTVNGQSVAAEVYTFGLDLDYQQKVDDAALAYITLDPSAKRPDGTQWWDYYYPTGIIPRPDGVALDIKNAWEAYCNGEDPWMAVSGLYGYTMKHPPDDILVKRDRTDLYYVDEYIPVDDPDELMSKFQSIITKVLNDTPFLPVSGGNDLTNSEDRLTYMDPIGKYMEVKDVKNILMFGKLYDIDKGKIVYYSADNQELKTVTPEATGDDAKPPGNYAYYEQYYVIKAPPDVASKYPDGDIPNPNYGTNRDGEPLKTFRLDEIRIYQKVTNDYIDPSLEGSAIQSDPGEDRALYIDIPVRALPTWIVHIETDGSGNVTRYDTTEEYFMAKPLRVFYTVGMEERVLTANKQDVDLSKISSAYLKTHREGGKVYFYSNWYNRNSTYTDYVTGEHGDENAAGYTYGDPVVSFSPSGDNRYYVFQKPLPLYAAPGVGANNVLDAGDVVTTGQDGTWTLNGSSLGKPYDWDFLQYLTAKDLADMYFYMVIDYFVPGSEASPTAPEYRAVARKGSEFGSGVGSDETGAGAYLCWYDTVSTAYKPFEMKDPADPDMPNAKWVLATKPGGLRVGDMAQSVQEKDTVADGEDQGDKDGGANYTDTADTFYLPSISSSSGADYETIKVNIYLGNNGRLTVSDTQLMVTKVMRELMPPNDPPSETEQAELEALVFDYTIKLTKSNRDPVTGTYNAIKVTLHDPPDKWRALINQIDLLTSNKGLLLGDDGNFATYIEGTGDQAKTYYIYVVGGENGAFTLFPNGNHSSLKDYLGDNTRGTIPVEAYLIPKDSYNNDWTFNENAAGVIKRTLNAVTVDLENPVGYEVDSDYEIRAHYETIPVTFNATGEASFTLKHGEGLLFTGLDPGTSYVVTEKLDVAKDVMLDKVAYERWEWSGNTLPEDKRTAAVYPYDPDEGGQLPSTGPHPIFDPDNGNYGFAGETEDDAVFHIHYYNWMPTSKLGIRKAIYSYGDIDFDFTFRLTLTLPEGKTPLKKTVTGADGVEKTVYYFPYTGSLFEFQSMDGMPVPEVKPPDGELIVTKEKDNTDGTTNWVSDPFTLRHGQRIELRSLPIGTTYIVAEDYVSEYTEITTDRMEDGTNRLYYRLFYDPEDGYPDNYHPKQGEIVRGETMEAVIVNVLRAMMPATGGSGVMIFQLMGLALLAAALMLGGLWRKRIFPVRRKGGFFRKC